MSFDQLGLAEPIVRAVAREGYTTPTPIQAKSIPHVLAGRDLLGCAQTGTGKTAAFALPILHHLQKQRSATGNGHSSHAPANKANGGDRSRRKRKPAGDGRKPRALILCPTRELGAQIGDSFAVYGKDLSLRHTVIFGGVGQFPQTRALRQGVDVIIATPGRLLDLMNQGHVDLSAIEHFVLDEADRMLDMGFIHDIRKVSAKLPRRKQTLLFSATMPQDIRVLAATLLQDPVEVAVHPVSSAVELIEQFVYHVPKRNKPDLLRNLLNGEAAGRTLVFTRTKHGADRVVKDLVRAGLPAEAIHGNKSQNARTKALQSFKGTNPPVLVSTDIASRGIDVDEVNHVINYDLPHEPETYVHRIGRTARAGASGVAIAFCDPDERGSLRAIERLTGRKIAVRNDMPEQSIAVAPSRGHQGGHQGGHQDGSPAPAPRDQPRPPRKNRSKAARNGGRNVHAAGKGRGSSPRSRRRTDAESREEQNSRRGSAPPARMPKNRVRSRAERAASAAGSRPGSRS